MLISLTIELLWKPSTDIVTYLSNSDSYVCLQELDVYAVLWGWLVENYAKSFRCCIHCNDVEISCSRVRVLCQKRIADPSESSYKRNSMRCFLQFQHVPSAPDRRTCLLCPTSSWFCSIWLLYRLGGRSSSLTAGRNSWQTVFPLTLKSTVFGLQSL
jgi:hypothetical protein